MKNIYILVFSFLFLPPIMSMEPDELLFEAIVKGDPKQLEEAINNNANVNAQDKTGKYASSIFTSKNIDSEGMSAIDFAIIKGNPEIVLLLIQNRVNMSNDTFTLALINGSYSIAKLLLKHGNFNVNQIANDGTTPLWDAAVSGDIGKVTLLLNRGANYNITCAPMLLKFLLAKGRSNDNLQEQSLTQQLNLMKSLLADMQNSSINPLTVNLERVIQVLIQFAELAEAVKTNPSQEVLKEAIKNDFSILVKQLIREGIAFDRSHIELAKLHTSREAGVILYSQLRFIEGSVPNFISSKGIVGTHNLTKDLALYVGRLTLD